MASIPTTQQNVDTAKAYLQSNLGQTSPIYDKSYINVMAGLHGMTKSELYQYSMDRVKQSLALSATGDSLTKLAANYGIYRTAEVAAELTVRFTGVDSSTVPQTTVWTGDENNVIYFQNVAYTISGTYVDGNIVAEDAGVDANLGVGDTLQIGSTQTGVANEAYVVAIVTLGAEKESDEDLRVRLLDEIRTVGGGSNSADIRTWGQQTPNVKRVDPYTGSVPFGSSIPGYRTVFVEASESFDPDGIPTSELLDATRQYITYDPDTGKARQALGSTDETLDVLPITRLNILVTVSGMEVPGQAIIEVKSAIDTALSEYAATLRPHILGLDPEAYKNNVISSGAVSDIVQGVIKSFGGYFNVAYWGFIPGVATSPYELNPGERISISVMYD